MPLDRDVFSFFFPREEEEEEELSFSFGFTEGLTSLRGVNPEKDSSEREEGLEGNFLVVKGVDCDWSPTCSLLPDRSSISSNPMSTLPNWSGNWSARFRWIRSRIGAACWRGTTESRGALGKRMDLVPSARRYALPWEFFEKPDTQV